MADYVSKDMINKAMQVDLLEYAKALVWNLKQEAVTTHYIKKDTALT